MIHKRVVVSVILLAGFVFNTKKINAQPRDTQACFRDSVFMLVGSFSSLDSFQWQDSTSSGWKDLTSSTRIDGVKNDTLFFNGIDTSFSNRKYRCIVDSVGAAKRYDTSLIATLIVYNPLKPPVLNGNQFICYRDSSDTISIDTLALGGNNLFEYTWYQASDSTSLIPTTKKGKKYQITGFGQSQYIAVNARSLAGCGDTMSKTIKIHVYRPLQAGTIKGDTSVCHKSVADTIRFDSLPRGGDSAYSYQWMYSSDGAKFSDTQGTDSFYVLGKLENSLFFKVIVSSGSGCRSDTSDTVFVKVWDTIAKPRIKGSQTICYDSNPDTLWLLGNSPNPLRIGKYHFQWEYSTTNGSSWNTIRGANDSMYYDSTLKLKKSRQYRLAIISDTGCASTYSNPVHIDVYSAIDAGKITALSHDTICYGRDSVWLDTTKRASGGGGNYKWQWLSSTDGVNYAPTHPNDTNQTLISDTLFKSVYYKLRVTSKCRIDTSNQVYIHVWDSLEKPNIQSDQSICYRTQPKKLDVKNKAQGADGKFSYTWKWRADNNDPWKINSSGNASGLQPGILDSSRYFSLCAKSNFGCGEVQSDAIKISVFEKFEGASITSPETICYDTQPKKFSIRQKAKGGDLTYIWQWIVSDNDSDWSDIPTASDTFFRAAKLAKSQYYSLVTTSGSNCGVDTSASIFIKVLNQLTKPHIGDSQLICFNTQPEELSLRTDAKGGFGQFRYQWEIGDGSGWQLLADSTRRFLQPSKLKRNTSYRIRASDSCGVINSGPVLVEVYDKLNAANFIGKYEICHQADTTIRWTTRPKGAGNLSDYSFQWIQSLNNTDFSKLPDEESMNLELRKGEKDVYLKQVVISNLGCGTDTSNVIYVNVLDLFVVGTITYEGIKDTLCYGQRPNKLIQKNPATGGKSPYDYQWIQRPANTSNWLVLSGATDTVFADKAIFQGKEYALIYTSSLGCGADTSNAIIFPVHPQPKLANILGADTVCRNQTDVHYEVSETDSTLDYKWKTESGQIISGSFLDNCYVHWNRAKGNGLDTLVLQQTQKRTSCISSVKRAVYVSADKAPSKTKIIQKTGSSMLICEDASSGLSYQWGYIEKASNKEHPQANSNYRYHLFSENIDTSKNSYYVKTSFGDCATISYFNGSPVPSVVQETKTSTLEVFPNPNQGTFQIQGAGFDLLQVLAFNVNGKNVPLSKKGNLFTLDTPTSGIVVLRVATNQGLLFHQMLIID